MHEWRVPPRLGRGGVVPCAIRLCQGGGAMAAHLPTMMCSAGRRTRTNNTASRIFRGSGGVVGGATTTDNDGGRGRREEVEGDESALAKLGGAMTDTTLAILMAGIVVSHLRMHRCKRDDADNDCYDDDDDDDGKGGGLPWTVLVDATAAAADLVLAHGRRWWWRRTTTTTMIAMTRVK